MIGHQACELTRVDNVVLLQQHEQLPCQVEVDVVSSGACHSFREVIEPGAPVFDAMRLRKALYETRNALSGQLVDIRGQPGRFGNVCLGARTDHVLHLNAVPPELALSPVCSDIDQANSAIAFAPNGQADDMHA
ncbi:MULTISPECIES: hypothetical protein [unclassified Caballeronia]|uniref:hypothetical protein n=1 Tax=unclassified Caballeronia TaxID=2646786 RepID=UPI00285CDEA5|nr:MULTISPECIES: hypothetical protein [unclassified Caballeronia]MDR5850550.1 hypothetical protein [Caballeronia sp. LZ003]